VILVIAMCAGAAALSSCAYEVGFEYQTEAPLTAIQNSGVGGTVVIGYGAENRSFRMRLALNGLRHQGQYQVRFLDAQSCDANALAHAKRIDARRDDPAIGDAAWGFPAEPMLLTGNALGHAELEVPLITPRAPSIHGRDPDKYPAVVIYFAKDAKSQVETPMKILACGAIVNMPGNRRPHM
jgi:hypothetical protein